MKAMLQVKYYSIKYDCTKQGGFMSEIPNRFQSRLSVVFLELLSSVRLSTKQDRSIGRNASIHAACACSWATRWPTKTNGHLKQLTQNSLASITKN